MVLGVEFGDSSLPYDSQCSSQKVKGVCAFSTGPEAAHVFHGFVAVPRSVSGKASGAVEGAVAPWKRKGLEVPLDQKYTNNERERESKAEQ